ncbi:MAG: hypothetical protein JKY88_16260 [Pseudomonadales bacterium]|nr:hypothetical protein [Pseudomonadales bacterium]
MFSFIAISIVPISLFQKCSSPFTHPKLQLLSLCVLILLSLQQTALGSGWGCDESKTIEHTFPRENIEALVLNALAGDLVVVGNNSDIIELIAEVCTDELKYLDAMLIDIEQTKTSLILTAIIPYNRKDWHADYAYMDLRLNLPKDLALELRDSSGNLSVKNTRLIGVDDSSGNIRISNSYSTDSDSKLIIKDSSGNIDIRGLRGNLEVTDSSGRMDIRDVEGDVYIPRDSSGNIEISRISGTVHIERDGSGDIDIEDIQQSVVVESDGSGNIDISDINGSVSIGRDGSGNVRVSRVGGDFLLESKGSGNIRTRDINGQISVPR